MGSVAFIGLGLNDERGLTQEGLEEARLADTAFAEFYTNKMPNLELGRLELLIGKKITVIDRKHLEDESGRDLVTAARKSRVAFLVPGDPMIATTHVSLRLSLQRLGIGSRIIHAPSIISAVCGATGLQNYKFGKSITLPYSAPVPGSVHETLSDNRTRGLHTLLFLDVHNASDELTINTALARIISENPAYETRLAIGLARIGSKDEQVRASTAGNLVREEFGNPPHSIIFPGKLHFMEADALKSFCGARDADLGDNR
jgi:diphthine synthase